MATIHATIKYFAERCDICKTYMPVGTKAFYRDGGDLWCEDCAGKEKLKEESKENK